MIPVFQMVLVPSTSGWELKFSEESNEFSQPLFVIPKKKILVGDEFVFPGEFRGKYINYVMRYDKKLTIDDVRLNQVVNFRLTSNVFSYCGKRFDIVKSYRKFIIIAPIDLSVMDKLFIDQGVCFVGLTPQFGKNLDY